MTASAVSNPGLVVPINLVGFCVSEADEQLATGQFAGTTVNYTQQTSGPNNSTQAYLGSNVWRPLVGQPTEKRLQAGIHLHWKLPDALSTSSVDATNTTLVYPAVPNRWLVTRFVINGGSATATSWVVESDALNATIPAGQTATPVTIALQPNVDNQPNFNYLGQSTPIASYSSANPLNGPRTFKTQTGAELSVVSNGVPTFSVYYPESSSVFGFFDPLSDLPATANLMYVVTGWYDATANDPATLSSDLNISHAWATQTAPDYTLYSGTVQNIAWNQTQNYVEKTANQNPVTAAAAIGNTPSEALSAYFRALDDPDNVLYEQMLNALQMGLLPGLNSDAPGTLGQLNEALHSSQFQAIDSGLIYTIVLTNTDGTESEARNLTQPQADALNELNISAVALEEVTTHVKSFQWEMFANWYRYFQTTGGPSSAVFNYGSSLYDQWAALSESLTAAQNDFNSQFAAVGDLLTGTQLTLKAGPAPRYWQPNDPVVLLAGTDLAVPSNYTEANSTEDGLLQCRPTDQLVSAVKANGVSIAAASFSAICDLPSSSLPYATDCSNLLIEACLLNTQIAASLSGASEASLQTALQSLLQGEDQTLWVIVTGKAPAPIAISWWGPLNPWIPLLLAWSTEFSPLFSTTFNSGSNPPSYPSNYVTANFTVDAETGSFLSYTPNAGKDSIVVNPASLSDFPQQWFGQSILSATAATNLAATLTDYLADNSDPTLQTVLEQLNNTPTMVQALSGFTLGLLLQQPIIQLNIAATNSSNYNAKYLTKNTQAIVGDIYDVAPYFQWYYNPIRGGWFRITPQDQTAKPLLSAVDVFGQKRDITIRTIAEANSMTAYGTDQKPVTGLSYAAPRLAQPARLLFEWISASASSLIELNDIPASSPICGWLLPNHLNGGFFLYDGVGRPLGSIELNGDQTTVIWQSAPGDNATINLPIEQALATANPVLKSLALALKAATPQWFLAFWSAIDQAADNISPDNLTTDAGLSVLIGRPVAIAQASLRLDIFGRPIQSASWSCLTGNEWLVTDNDFPDVKFPVVLGDIDNLNDGLLGYFLQDQKGGYDLATFYSDSADATATSGVLQPSQDTILVTPTPKYDDPEPAPLAAESLSLLLLIDPRAPVHATSGILPTGTLQIPSDIAAAAMSILEVSFMVAPVLSAARELTLPVPREPGYAVSFVKESLDQANGDKPVWLTLSDIAAPNIDAVWSYSPQTLLEGWLRLNPALLSFEILNSTDQNTPLIGGTAQKVNIKITNLKPFPITFQPGEIAPEGTPATGSIFYVHFGNLVDQQNVASMTFTATGWMFQSLNDTTYGHYWAATPTAAVTLNSGCSFDIAISGLKPATNAVQANVTTDYFSIDGLSDGVFIDQVTIKQGK